MNIRYRLVNTQTDLELIFYWRQNPLIYKYFSMQIEPLEWQNHLHFWTTYNSRIDWIIQLDDRNIGSVFFKIINCNVLDIGIYISDLMLRGKGIGSKSIQFAIAWATDNGYSKVTALIHRENKASINMFEKNGFKYVSEYKTDFLNYEWSKQNAK